MPYVYILSDHEDDGSKNAIATLDRSLLMRMVEDNWSWETAADEVEERILMKHVHNAQQGLAEILKKPDDELAATRCGWDCQSGWGGVQLHVISLVSE